MKNYNHFLLENNNPEVKEGDYIRLIYMSDQYAIEPGEIGKINWIDDFGNLHIDWLNQNSSLSLLPNIDEYELVSDKEVDIYLKTKDFNL